MEITAPVGEFRVYLLFRDADGNPVVDGKLDDLDPGLAALLTPEDRAYLRSKENADL